MERPGNAKPFALTSDVLDGASRAEPYNNNAEFQQAKELHNMCMIYATAYNETMLKRLEKEKPEFYEENNISRGELVAHLTNNMCLTDSKYKSKVFRDTTAQLKEKEHLNDQMRRLVNGGDRFHPYF